MFLKYTTEYYQLNYSFSDHTLYARVRIIMITAKKFLNFRQNLSALVRGWQLVRGCWCHMTLLATTVVAIPADE